MKDSKLKAGLKAFGKESTRGILTDIAAITVTGATLDLVSGEDIDLRKDLIGGVIVGSATGLVRGTIGAFKAVRHINKLEKIDAEIERLNKVCMSEKEEA